MYKKIWKKIKKFTDILFDFKENILVFLQIKNQLYCMYFFYFFENYISNSKDAKLKF